MVHLHVHTKYSLRDSIINYEDLINHLKLLEQNAIAVTDHGNIFASVSIYKKLNKAGIKYVHGCEMYVCDDVQIKDIDNKYYHLVVLCKNEIGRINLNKLISKSNLPENFYSKPRIDFAMLKEHKEGLIILSACVAGEIGRFILDNYNESKSRALKYKEEFGDDYYLEIQSRKDNYQIEINKKIIDMAKEINVSLVVTTDAHFTSLDDKKYHNVYAFNSSYKEQGEGYVDCYIQHEDEVRANLYYLDKYIIDEAINNTHIIAGKCSVEIPLSEPIIPHVDVPTKYNNEKEWLEDICREGFIKRGVNALSESEKQIYIDRYNYELAAITEMGFTGYYLLIYSYANKVKRRGIARGSGGGSLIAYLMNIVDIDPIEHKLYFERFIDVGALDLLKEGKITRKELKVPDIDLDFGTKDRDEIIKGLIDRYGREYVACIGRFNYNQDKGTLTDIGRALNIEHEEVKKITKTLGNKKIVDMIELMQRADNSENTKFFAAYYEKYPDLFDISLKLIGLPSSFGLHPCGRIIVTKDLDYYTASCYHSSGERILQGDMHDIEDLGIVKVDILGLKTVDVIYDTLDLINKDYDYINPKKLNYSDENVLKIFKDVDTVGIFQFESWGMKQTLKNMQPESIEDLSAANALYRPGSMDYIEPFCNRKKGKEKIAYLHEDLIPILSNSYGIMIFQEQLIEIGKLAKLKNPDKLRKATGKKIKELLDEIQPELKEKLMLRNWTEDQFTQLWDDMLKFAKYSFNKSHSSAYAIIAFITAKLKAYHPEEFYVSLMNSYFDDSAKFVNEESETIINDILEHKITISHFDFRKDHRKCNIEQGKINYAIQLIKDCNYNISKELYSLRKKRYRNFIEMLYDINNTSINSKQLDILIKLDFFKEFGNSNLLSQVNQYFVFFKNGKTKQIKSNKIQDNIILTTLLPRFSRLSDSGATYMDIKVPEILNEIEEWLKCANIKDYLLKDKLDFQKSVLGFINPITGEENDRRKLLILATTPLIAAKTGKPWSYVVESLSLGSGKKGRFTIWSKTFDKTPLKQYDIINAKRENKNDKGYWYLEEYSKIEKID